MKVKDFSGYENSWPPTGYEVNLNDTRPRSQYHIKARQLLKELYPTQKLLEEVPIPGERLFLDFYLPLQNTAIEVQGEQHNDFNRFFHGSKLKYLESKKRDIRKREWCELNNITFVEFRYNESEEEWKNKLT